MIIWKCSANIKEMAILNNYFNLTQKFTTITHYEPNTTKRETERKDHFTSFFFVIS